MKYIFYKLITVTLFYLFIATEEIIKIVLYQKRNIVINDVV